MEERVVTALAAKAKAGDASAFERLYSSHVNSILFHVRNLLIDKESYTDVAQDVALEMFKNIHRLREPAAFRGWMHQIVRNVCTSHNRQYLSQSKRVDLTEDDETLEAVIDEGADADPEAITMADMEGNWLYVKLSELPLSYREIITQFYYDEMSYKEIAEALGISVTNVSSRLQRAVEAARNKVGDMSEGTGAPGKDIREATMVEEQTHTPTSEDSLTVVTDPKLEEKGLEDDIGLKHSLTAAVAMFATDDTTKAVLSSVHTKIVAATSATLATGAAGAAAAAGKGITIAGWLLTTVTLVFALTVGGLAVYHEGGIFNTTGEETQKHTETSYYEGSMHILFSNAAGKDSDQNIQSAQLIEDTPVSVATSWNLYLLGGSVEATGEGTSNEYAAAGEGGVELPSGASLLSSGSGSVIESSVLSTLAPGSYQVVFSLQDAKGATAEITRTFAITE